VYDLIGDIHGHAEELEKLLIHLGYSRSDSGYSHPERKVIFLGDFIDRGEKLAQHRRLLELVMKMVRSGHALAVMGNHEFNALAYHTEHKGRYLRPHTEKNRRQHQAFLNEYDNDSEAKRAVLGFFYELPMWLDLDGFRVVHACWDQKSIDLLTELAGREGYLNSDLLVRASTEGAPEYDAIETLLKGHEIELPEGVSFRDKDGNERSHVRVKWWNSSAESLKDLALPEGVEIGEAGEMPVPEGIPFYNSSAKPCFLGHYWLRGEPEPLACNVACLDYSVAKEGKLVAYRWQGESMLIKENFTHANLAF